MGPSSELEMAFKWGLSLLLISGMLQIALIHGIMLLLLDYQQGARLVPDWRADLRR